MTTLINGLLGGLLAGLIAAAALRAAGGYQSLIGSLRGRTENEGGAIGWLGSVVTELVYATAAGGLLVALELNVLDVLSVEGQSGAEVLWLTLGWAALLLAIGLALWRISGGRSFRQAPFRDLLAFHLTYALVLAAWIRLTWIT